MESNALYQVTCIRLERSFSEPHGGEDLQQALTSYARRISEADFAAILRGEKQSAQSYFSIPSLGERGPIPGLSLTEKKSARSRRQKAQLIEPSPRMGPF